MDYEVFHKITYDELTMPPYDPYDEEQAPNIMEMTNLFNYVVYWIYRKIFCEFTPETRAKVIVHFIRIAMELEKLNNFISQFAVLSALNSVIISRMKETWKFVPTNMKRRLEKMNDLLSFENNFASLRNRLLNIKSRCIPFIGLYQKDVIAIDAAQSLSRGDVTDVADKEIQLKKLWSSLAEFQKYNYDNLKNHIMIQLYLEPEIYSKAMLKALDNEYYIWSKVVEP